jgi:hypothetical protein
VNEAEHIDRLRAFAHWFAMNGGHMTEECKDALTLLADYDALKARLAHVAPLLMEADTWLEALQLGETPTKVGVESIRNLRAKLDAALTVCGYARADGAGEG